MRKEIGKLMSREEVAAIVREVIVDTTATSEFTDDSHFVYDLNLD